MGDLGEGLGYQMQQKEKHPQLTQSEESQWEELSLQDYQMMLLEQQHMKRLQLAQLEETQSKKTALEEYKMQMQLLEQQKEERLQFAQLEENRSKNALADYQMQMQLSELQKKKKSDMQQQGRSKFEDATRKQKSQSLILPSNGSNNYALGAATPTSATPHDLDKFDLGGTTNVGSFSI